MTGVQTCALPIYIFLILFDKDVLLEIRPSATPSPTTFSRGRALFFPHFKKTCCLSASLIDIVMNVRGDDDTCGIIKSRVGREVICR